MSALKCRLCLTILKKTYRSVSGPAFPTEAICEVLGITKQDLQKHKKKSYVCSACYNKLNRLDKLNFELKNSMDKLIKNKKQLIQEMIKNEIVTPSASGSGMNNLF